MKRHNAIRHRIRTYMVHNVGHRAREFRCCKEVAEAIGKFTFIGLDAGCIVEHEDYSHLTHRAVLTEVAPLLRDKNGKRYKRQTGATENE
jgi:hypothetical protein